MAQIKLDKADHSCHMPFLISLLSIPLSLSSLRFIKDMWTCMNTLAVDKVWRSMEDHEGKGSSVLRIFVILRFSPRRCPFVTVPKPTTPLAGTWGTAATAPLGVHWTESSYRRVKGSKRSWRLKDWNCQRAKKIKIKRCWGAKTPGNIKSAPFSTNLDLQFPSHKWTLKSIIFRTIIYHDWMSVTLVVINW